MGLILLIFWFFHWLFIQPDTLLCCNIRVWAYLYKVLLVYCVLYYLLILFLLSVPFSLLQRLNYLPCSSNHIILRIQNILPIYCLIHCQTHWWSNLSRYTWRLYCPNYLVLELSHHIIYKIYHCSRCVKCCRNVIQCQRYTTILSDLYIINFTINCL